MKPYSVLMSCFRAFSVLSVQQENMGSPAPVMSYPMPRWIIAFFGHKASVKFLNNGCDWIRGTAQHFKNIGIVASSIAINEL